MEYFEFIHSYKRRTRVLTRSKIAEFCERYKRDIGIFDLKSKRFLPRTVKQRDICLCIHQNHYCVIWKRNRGDSLLNGVEETERNFNYVKNQNNLDKIGQRIR